MTIDIAKLKTLAEAAKNDCGDYVALNDYGMAVPPAVVLDLISEVERLERNRDMWKGQVERQAEELTSLRAEVEEWKGTLKFNEGCWSEERGTMIDKLQSARTEVERLGLKADSLEFAKWSCQVNQDAITKAGHETIDDLAAERDELKAKLMHQEVEAGTLAERMKAAGMMTVNELLAGAPLDAFHRHAGVNSLETFGQWLEMRRREYVTMQASRTLDKREDDDLYEWVLAHAGVFGEVHVNFKAAMAANEKKG